jgi:Ca2+-binding RTX toxin-like protein
MLHRWLALAVMAATLLFGAAGSQAAEVAVVDSQLVVTGSGDVNDIIDIRPTAFGYEVHDARDEITVGPGCGTPTPRLAYCGFLIVSVKVDGGAGNDLIGLWDVDLPVEMIGGEGNDFLEGGRVADSVSGGAGDDGIVGGEGNDLLTAGDGADVVQGGQGTDTIQGGAGDDVLEGESGDGNVVLGGEGRDLLRGGPLDDRLNGDQGDDALLGGGGDDVVETGPGSDAVFDVEARDDVRCSSRDRVRVRSGVQTTCRTLSGVIRRPIVWPPLDSARAAALPFPDPRVKARIRRPGAPKRTTVCIDYARWVPGVTVRVRILTRSGGLVKRFSRVMAASTCKSFRRPRPGQHADHARGRVRGSL